MTVKIPIQVDSQIDLEQYQKFAVLPFANVGKPNDTIRVPKETGEEIALSLRYRLNREKGIEITKTLDTAVMIGDDTPDLGNIDQLVEIGESLEVDAVVIGSYKFFNVSQPKRYYTERYSQSLQRYVTYYQDYLEKTYILSLRIVVADVKTKEIIWDEVYDRRASEAHTLGSMIISEITPTSGILKSLIRQGVIQFSRKISPHYEMTKRFLVK